MNRPSIRLARFNRPNDGAVYRDRLRRSAHAVLTALVCVSGSAAVASFLDLPTTGLGCTLPDGDGDGFADDCDNCVGVFNPEQGAPFMLSGQLVANGHVIGMATSPNGATAVYVADAEVDERFEIYSVPVAGGASPVKLNGTLVMDGDVNNDGGRTFTINLSGSHVVYAANQDTRNKRELYSVPIEGPAGSGVKLNGTFVNTSGLVSRFAITPDGTRVVYAADLVTQGTVELFSVSIGGPAANGVKLSGALVAGGDVIEFAVTPDGSHVVYIADQVTNDKFELYAVPIAGPASSGVQLNATLQVDGDVSYFRASPDGDEVIYLADQIAEGISELFIVPIGGGLVTKLSQTLSSAPGVAVQGRGPTFGSGGSRVVYRARTAPLIEELFSVPTIGGAPNRLNGTLPPNESVQEFNIDPSGTTVVYTAPQDIHTTELYAVPVDAGAAPIKLNDPLTLAEAIGNWPGFLGAPIADGRAFYGQLDANNDYPRLWSVPIDRSEPPIALSDPLPNSGGIFPFPAGRPGPEDGDTMMAYLTDEPSASTTYVVPLDGACPPAVIDPISPGGVDDSQITKNGWFVVSRVGALYSQRLDEDCDGVLSQCDTCPLDPANDVDGDGVCGSTDNCPQGPNPAQGPAVFGQTVLASSKTTFSWTSAVDAKYVKGPLNQVGSYVVAASGPVSGTVLTDVAPPALGQGFYFLLALGGDCSVASWQSVLGAEPGRDASLP